MGYTISWEPLRFTDFTYRIVLTLLPKILLADTTLRIEDWGFVIGESDDDCVPFLRNGEQTPWSKTNRLPYTKEVMKALILMVEYGVTSNLDHDDTDMTWYIEALDKVHSIHPLQSYEQQKAYFLNKTQL
jgi:hypothetical protein